MEVVVKTKSGEIRGRVHQGVASFKGIPYAAPPFGANRLAPPVPPEAWEGVRDAFDYGATAPKPPYPSPLDQLLPEPVIAGHDCLNLNVWTPDPAQSALPVMVWIHGGGFSNGTGAIAQYEGDRFARDGVVCVTINYRLGCDGFLFLDDAVANRGLLDQVAALEWVQTNIAAFGGDPGNVTIFGESAGGMSVSSLLSMPKAQGLFRRAIAQSGAGHHVLSVDTARLVTTELASRLGVPATLDGIASVPLNRLVEEHFRLASDIAASPDPSAWREISLNLMAFEPVVDGDVLPARPIEGVAGGMGGDTDLLIGSNSDEHRLFLVPSGVMGVVDEAMLGAMSSALGLDTQAIEVYRTGEASPGAALSAVLTDWFFRIPALRMAEAHQGRSYVYQFGWKSPLFDGQLGSCHALEIGFVFDTLTAEGGDRMYGSEAPADLAATMHRAWVDFASSGDPGWPAYETVTRPTMYFDVESGLVKDPDADRRILWDGIR